MRNPLTTTFGLILIFAKLKIGMLKVIEIIGQLLISQTYHDDLHSFKVKIKYAFNRRLRLLVEQNDPDYEDDIKLFLGGVLELENSSDHLDLERFTKAQLQRWRKQAMDVVKGVERYLKATRDDTYLAESKLLSYLSRTRIKVIIELPHVAVSIIQYIYNSGGLKGERSAHITNF